MPDQGQGETRNLYQRGGTWYARLEVNGRSERVSLRTGDLAEARQERDRLVKRATALRAGREPEEATTWQDAVVAYTKGVLDREGALAATTAERYRDSLRMVGPHLAGRSLESVDVRAIGAMVTARQDEGVKNATIKRDLTAVSRVLAFAANQGMTTTGNPAKAYDRAFLGEDRAVLAPPSDAAITKAAKWMDEVHPQWGALLRWLRATGMRLGETMAARRTDLVEAIEHGRHVTRLAITRPKGARRGRMRLISLSPEALALLPLLGADQLFDHWDVSVPGNVSSQWGAHRRQEGVPHFRLHDLRHAHAVAELRKDPTALYRISRHLGHSSVATTERHYLRFLSDEAQHLAKYGTPSQTPSQGEKRDRAKKLQIVK